MAQPTDSNVLALCAIFFTLIGMLCSVGLLESITLFCNDPDWPDLLWIFGFGLPLILLGGLYDHLVKRRAQLHGRQDN